MCEITQFEDLSNDLLLEIFEYFHALDLFTAFSLLNQRISSTLSSTQLHVVISKLHCRYQMKFLSSYLTHHANQVISISLEDQIRDYSSVISFFFNQHTFINLRSCKFYSICPSLNFNDVIEDLQKFTKLVSFRIFQPKNMPLSDIIRKIITKTILTHQSLTLRTINLSFYYAYSNLVANIGLNSTLTSLYMIFNNSNSNDTISIYSFLPILRHYRVLRILSIAILNDSNINNQQAILPTLCTSYENNPPVSPSIRTFDLTIRTPCNFQSLAFILHCMPNLHRFIITIIYLLSIPLRWRKLLDGYQWKQILTTNTPYLDIFDILLVTDNLHVVVPNTDIILKSFASFTSKYDDWYVTIHRSSLLRYNQNPQICLRGFRHSKKDRCCWNINQARIVLGSNILPLTTVPDVQHHLIYSYIKNLCIDIPVNRIIFDTQSVTQLFKNIDCLTIELNSTTFKFWEDIFDLFNCFVIHEIDQNERAEKILNLVDLTNITKLEIQPRNDISHLYLIKKILLASSRLIHLKIGNSLIFSPILYDHISLIPVFNRLQSLYLLTESIGFPLNYISKIIVRFPSLIHLELEIYSIDKFKMFLDILLDGLPKLIHLKIHFHKNILLSDGTCLINYILSKHRQTFPYRIFNDNEVYTKINEKIMDIYLSGCSICAKI